MKGKQNLKRRYNLDIRLTAAEKKSVEESAEKLGLTVSGYIRLLIKIAPASKIKF